MSCALTALSLQQWVRPRATLSRDSLPEQVRSAALFATRIERCRKLVEGLHALKFLSLHLFFIGLLFFFRAVSRPIFHTALVWAVFFLMFHVYQKCTVFLRSGCPSYTLQHYHSNDSIPTNLENSPSIHDDNYAELSGTSQAKTPQRLHDKSTGKRNPSPLKQTSETTAAEVRELKAELAKVRADATVAVTMVAEHEPPGLGGGVD